MITKQLNIEDHNFIVPAEITGFWPGMPLADLRHSCGAGEGIGDLIVPEKIFGLRVTPSCSIHDLAWDYAEPTWADFHQSNSMFFHNLLELIRVQSANVFMRKLRYGMAVNYYLAVDSVGAGIFKKLRGEIQ